MHFGNFLYIFILISLTLCSLKIRKLDFNKVTAAKPYSLVQLKWMMSKIFFLLFDNG